jgi:hypothetical protein
VSFATQAPLFPVKINATVRFVNTTTTQTDVTVVTGSSSKTQTTVTTKTLTNPFVGSNVVVSSGTVTKLHFTGTTGNSSSTVTSNNIKAITVNNASIIKDVVKLSGTGAGKLTPANLAIVIDPSSNLYPISVVDKTSKQPVLSGTLALIGTAGIGTHTAGVIDNDSNSTPKIVVEYSSTTGYTLNLFPLSQNFQVSANLLFHFTRKNDDFTGFDSSFTAGFGGPQITPDSLVIAGTVVASPAALK